jgi:hypothetical protein
MGFLNKLLNFGSDRRGKIIAWAAVGFGFFIFLGGILLASLSTETTSPRIITLAAPNMQYKTPTAMDGTMPGYYMTVTSKQTSISVLPNPTTANAPVTFTKNSNLIDVTPRVPSGGTAILTIKRMPNENFEGGMYEFTDFIDPYNKITIEVNCGSRKAMIYVTIKLRPEDARVVASLESNTALLPNDWRATDRLEMKYFDPLSPQYYDPLDPTIGSQYRMRLEFYLFGDLVYDTIANPEHYTHFGYIDLDPWGSSSGIKLFDNESSASQNYVDPPIIADHVTFNFKIWCKFGKEYYYSQTDINILVIPNEEGW